MNVFPAIDIRGGKAVRLLKGDYAAETVYRDDPLHAARDFKAAGANYIHVVDLDGARDGVSDNFPVIRSIVELGLFAQVGGGIRTAERVREVLGAGASRVIIGTAAADLGFTCRLVEEFGDKIAVGVDARNGKVSLRGWREDTDIDAFGFCLQLGEIGVKTIIYTDISRDGTLSGFDAELYRELSRMLPGAVIASGGASSLKDLEELREMNLAGVILGKALYAGTIRLEDALCLQNG